MTTNGKSINPGCRYYEKQIIVDPGDTEVHMQFPPIEIHLCSHPQASVPDAENNLIIRTCCIYNYYCPYHPDKQELPKVVS